MARTIAALFSTVLLLSSGVAVAEESAQEETAKQETAKDEGARGDPNFKPNTLIGDGELHWGGFGSPVLKISSVDGRGAVLMGGRGAAVLNHAFAFGGGGFALVGGGTDDRSFAYGGPAVNFIFFAEKLVHFDLGLMVGWGSTSVADGPSRGVFVLEPEANLELNVAKNFRIALGASYRYVGESGGVTSAAKGLGGVSGNLAFRFGSF